MKPSIMLLGLGWLALAGGCTCAESHMPDLMSDAGVAMDAGESDAASGGTDGEVADGSDAGAGPPPCAISCSTGPIAAGYAPDGWVPLGGGPVEILATAASPDGWLHALLASGRRENGVVGRQWILVSRAPGASRFEVADERTWPDSPSGAGDFEGIGHGLDAAVLRVLPDAIEATVLLTVRDGSTGLTPHGIHVARIAWDADGTLLDAGDLGRILTLPDGNLAGTAAVFALPSGNVIAAIEHEGVIEGVRIAEDAIVEHVSLGESGSDIAGAGPLAGLAIDEEHWLFAGGGLSWSGLRPTFASAVITGEPAWRDTLPSGDRDPPPRLTRSGDVGIALQWHQSPDDIDDASLTATRLLTAGAADVVRVPTPRLPMPLDAYAGRAGTGAFAIWSVRAADELDDALAYTVLLDGLPECPATQAASVARIHGGAATPTIHATAMGEDLAVFALPSGDGGNPRLTALQVRCRVE